METGASLAVPVSVRKLQTTFHAKAKQNPEFRFYTLRDKVWQEAVLKAAWQAVRRNGGSAGGDGETVAAIETRRVGEVVWGTGGRPADGCLLPASGSLGAGTDLRGRLATETVCLPDGARCLGRGPAGALAVEHRSPGGSGRGSVQLFRRDPACRVAAEFGPAHQRRAARGLLQGMAGDGRGGRHRTGRPPAHGPGAS